MQGRSDSRNEPHLNSSLFRSFAKYVRLHGKQGLEILWLLVRLGKHVLAITRLHTSAGRSVQAPPFEFQRTRVVHCCRRGSSFFKRDRVWAGGLLALILNTFSTNPPPPYLEGRLPHMVSGSSTCPCGVLAGDICICLERRRLRLNHSGQIVIPDLNEPLR